MPTPNSILVDAELRDLLGSVLLPSEGAPPPESGATGQIQPTSFDLRLGPRAHEIRASYLPVGRTVESRLEELEVRSISLEGGAVLERGKVYLVPLDDELRLPADLSARFNPRSSTGRCDVFTRVVVPGHPRFDEAPAGWSGRPWVEVAPLSFDIHLARGDRLCQVRLSRGVPALTHDELVQRYEETPLCFDDRGPLGADAVRFDGDGGLELRVGLEGRSPCAWRARDAAAVPGPVRFAERGAHRAEDFWEPVHPEPPGHCVLEPGHFYIFASRERIRVPSDLAAEMLPVDVGIGELRNNYAGFFDAGFGWDPHSPNGTPAVLEVRAHDVPFLVEDGQILFRLRYFRTSREPERLYGDGRASYRDQDLTLARAFANRQDGTRFPAARQPPPPPTTSR